MAIVQSCCELSKRYSLVSLAHHSVIVVLQCLVHCVGHNREWFFLPRANLLRCVNFCRLNEECAVMDSTERVKVRINFARLRNLSQVCWSSFPTSHKGLVSHHWMVWFLWWCSQLFGHPGELHCSTSWEEGHQTRHLWCYWWAGWSVPQSGGRCSRYDQQSMKHNWLFQTWWKANWKKVLLNRRLMLLLLRLLSYWMTSHGTWDPWVWTTKKKSQQTLKVRPTQPKQTPLSTDGLFGKS